MNLREKFPHASKDFLKANGQLPATEPKQADAVALGKAQKRSRPIRGRITLRYRYFAVRPLDTDNLAGATKICTDTLTKLRLLSSDNPFQLRIEWEQEKVVHFEDEKLEIEIL